jgi:hypothetical protein
MKYILYFVVLILALDEGSQGNLCSSHFTSSEKAPYTLQTGGLVCPHFERAGEEKFLPVAEICRPTLIQSPY